MLQEKEGTGQMEENQFFTLTGYQLQENKKITHAMEDYLEMMERIRQEKNNIHVKDIASKLNVRASSVTKMIQRLKENHLVTFEKYGIVQLTEKGKEYAKYFLYRHNLLVSFFQKLNQKDYSLKQVEKVEHFLDVITLQNIEKLMNSTWF